MPYLVTQGQGGALITYTAKNAVFNRRDVINNADILGPLIQQLGMRPSIYQIAEIVEDFFWRVRPRGKPPVDGNTVKMQAWGLRNLVTEFARAARRPHVPREPAMRSLYVSAGIPLPEGSEGPQESAVDEVGYGYGGEEEGEEEPLEEDPPCDVSSRYPEELVESELREVRAGEAAPDAGSKREPVEGVRSPAASASSKSSGNSIVTEFPKGRYPPEYSPEKVEDRASQKFHSIIRMDDGFECKFCSAFAPDLNVLKAVPCVRGPPTSAKAGSAEAELLAKQEKLLKLKHLQSLNKHLQELLEKRDVEKTVKVPQKSLSARPPAVCPDNVETQILEEAPAKPAEDEEKVKAKESQARVEGLGKEFQKEQIEKPDKGALDVTKEVAKDAEDKAAEGLGDKQKESVKAEGVSVEEKVKEKEVEEGPTKPPATATKGNEEGTKPPVEGSQKTTKTEEADHKDDPVPPESIKNLKPISPKEQLAPKAKAKAKAKGKAKAAAKKRASTKARSAPKKASRKRKTQEVAEDHEEEEESEARGF